MATKNQFCIVLMFAVVIITSSLGCTRYSSREEPRAVAAIEKDGIQEVKIRVKGEYTPERILVKKNKPLHLIFYRDDTSACTEHIVLEDFAIKQKLAPHQETVVVLTPTSEGEFVFKCGMDMLQGKLIVKN